MFCSGYPDEFSLCKPADQFLLSFIVDQRIPLCLEKPYRHCDLFPGPPEYFPGHPVSLQPPLIAGPIVLKFRSTPSFLIIIIKSCSGKAGAILKGFIIPESMLSQGIVFSPSQGTHKKGSSVGDHRRDVSGTVEDHRRIQDPFLKFSGIFRQGHGGNGSAHRMSEKQQRQPRVLFPDSFCHIAKVFYISPETIYMHFAWVFRQTIRTPMAAVFRNIYRKSCLIEIPGQLLIFFRALAEAMRDQDHSPGFFLMKRKAEDLPAFFPGVPAFSPPGIKAGFYKVFHFFRKILFI